MIFCYKIYFPFNGSRFANQIYFENRTGYDSEISLEFWGIETIPENIDHLVITEGQKDAMAINSHANQTDANCFAKKVWAIAKDFPFDVIGQTLIELSEKYNIVYCFDADEAGQAITKKFQKKVPAPSINLKLAINRMGYSIRKESKDIADLFELVYKSLKEGECITDRKSFFNLLFDGL